MMYGKNVVCAVDGCEGHTIAKGWCWKHYQRDRRHGDVTAVNYGGGGIPKNRKCDVPDCDKKHYGHGLCVMHYGRCYQNGITPSLEAVKEWELSEAFEIMERWGYLAEVRTEVAE